MILVLAAALSVNLNLSTLVDRASQTTRISPTCHIHTVSYRFEGKPGTKFRYDGDEWTVPGNGWIELIATGAKSYQLNGRSLPLEVWPLDGLGMRTVPLPSAID